MDLIKQLDNKAAKQGKKADTFSLARNSQTSLLQLKDVVFSTAVDLRRTAPRPVIAPSGVSSRSGSPFSRRSSPPRSATPIPTMSGLSFSKNIADSLKKTNELLNQEVQKLRSQVHCCFPFYVHQAAEVPFINTDFIAFLHLIIVVNDIRNDSKLSSYLMSCNTLVYSLTIH
jgi:hypothetical protein